MPLSSLSCKRKKMAANSLMTEYHDCVNMPLYGVLARVSQHFRTSGRAISTQTAMEGG